MTQVSTIGLDLAKNVFQVHGIATDGTVVIRRRLRRAEVVPFSRVCRPVSSAWRPAQRRITGRGNSVNSATRSG